MSTPVLDIPPHEDGAHVMGAGHAAFGSILFPGAGGPTPDEVQEAPDFFHDLSLDRVIAAVTAGREEYDLEPFFHGPLTSLDAIAYRQEVMRDMEGPAAKKAIAVFAERLRTMRLHLPTEKKRQYELEKQRWFLDAVLGYTDAVEGLARDLDALDLTSRGLRACRDALADHAGSEAFRALAADARAVDAALMAIRFCILIRGGTVVVRAYDGEGDYSTAVGETFRKFQQGSAKDYRHKLKNRSFMDHVEAQIVERVALLHPDAFDALARFCERHAHFVDPTIARFDREIQFYVSYLDHVERLDVKAQDVVHPGIRGKLVVRNISQSHGGTRDERA